MVLQDVWTKHGIITVEEDSMVTSDMPAPGRKNKPIVSNIFEQPARCKVCDTPFEGRINWEQERKRDSRPCGFCKNCGHERPYFGPQRPNLCLSCVHGVTSMSRKHKGKVFCADGLVRRENGEWVNQYGRHILDNGNPVQPQEMRPQFNCAYYDPLEGKTREEVRVADPLRFYRRTG